MANLTVSIVIISAFVTRLEEFISAEENLGGLGWPDQVDDPAFVVDTKNPNAPVPQVANPVSKKDFLGSTILAEIYEKMVEYESKKAKADFNVNFKASRQATVDGKDVEKAAFIS